MKPDSYVSFLDIPRTLPINKGDSILISSAMKDVVKTAKDHDDETDFNRLIDAFIEAVGPEGTVLFPVYNWDWCKGTDFDYINTPSQVGSFSQVALSRPDFKRTRHPIYSFAVYGKGQQELCAMNNVSAFGADSPFNWMLSHGTKNVIINCKFHHSFTFVHYVEEELLPDVRYRYLKNFRAEYTDEQGCTEERTYSMCVRSYDYEVEEAVDDYEPEWLACGAQQNVYVNDIRYAVIDLAKAYPVIRKDILENRSRCLCRYKGQNGEDIPLGERMYGLVRELFPICRSITGEGFRNSLQIIKSYIPGLEIRSIPSGTQVYDWVVPNEWNIREAYIEDEQGNRIIDFKENNLHVIGYSYPMDEWMDLEELKKIVVTLPDQPEWIPYVTSYYNPRSGFCMSQKMLDGLKDGRYHAVIKSSLDEHGCMNYGELVIPGQTDEEVLLSTYLCHPSMANNECSGPAVMTFLCRYLQSLQNRRYSYRILFLPETIGAVAWLSGNYDRLDLRNRIKCGFVLNCMGDDRTYSFVHTRYADTLTDRILEAVLKEHYPDYNAYSFLERGSDERQYDSPLIALPVCSVCRSLFHKYPEYHTSADDLSLVTPDGLSGSYELMIKCVSVLEHNKYYKMTIPCEPQMGKRGLYKNLSVKGSSDSSKTLMDFMAYCDGRNDLIGISELIETPAVSLIDIADKLEQLGIIEECVS